MAIEAVSRERERLKVEKKLKERFLSSTIHLQSQNSLERLANDPRATANRLRPTASSYRPFQQTNSSRLLTLINTQLFGISQAQASSHSPLTWIENESSGIAQQSGPFSRAFASQRSTCWKAFKRQHDELSEGCERR